MDRPINRLTKKREPAPRLMAGFLCERVLREVDQVVSFIRMVDILNVPQGMTFKTGSIVGTRLHLVVSLNNNGTKGKRTLEVHQVGPSKKRRRLTSIPVDFAGDPEAGQTIVLPINLRWEQPGLYWLEAFLDKVLYVRAPLRIRIVEPGSEQR
jgi:hypothetical protein